MNLLDEVLAPEEVGDPVERVIVDEDRAEQRLLRFEIMRRRAIGAFLRLRLALRELFDGRHGSGASPGGLKEEERERRESGAIMRCRAEAQQVRAMLCFDGRFDPKCLLAQAERLR